MSLEDQLSREREHNWRNAARIREQRAEINRLLARLAKLRDAVRRAGFAVCQTSGDWTIHDVSELGKAEEARTLEVVNRNVDLEVENQRLQGILDAFLHDAQGNGFIGESVNDALAWAARQMAEAFRLRGSEAFHVEACGASVTLHARKQ